MIKNCQGKKQWYQYQYQYWYWCYWPGGYLVSPQYQNPNYRPALFLTHRGGEDDNPEDVHPVAGSFPSADEHVRGRSQIQGEVLDVGAIVVLDAVDELPPGGGLGLGLAHRGLGLHAVFNAGSILSVMGVRWTTTRTAADVTRTRTNKKPVCLQSCVLCRLCCVTC